MWNSGLLSGGLQKCIQSSCAAAAAVERGAVGHGRGNHPDTASVAAAVHGQSAGFGQRHGSSPSGAAIQHRAADAPADAPAGRRRDRRQRQRAGLVLIVGDRLFSVCRSQESPGAGVGKCSFRLNLLVVLLLICIVNVRAKRKRQQRVRN